MASLTTGDILCFVCTVMKYLTSEHMWYLKKMTFAKQQDFFVLPCLEQNHKTV